MSGINPSDEALAAFGKVKTSKAEWAVFEVVNEKSVECVQSYEKGYSKQDKATNFAETYSELEKYILENFNKEGERKPCFVVVDFQFKTGDGRDTSKLLLLSWNPAGIKVKAKMLHGSTLNSVKNAFDGIQAAAVNISNPTELEFASVSEHTG